MALIAALRKKLPGLELFSGLDSKTNFEPWNVTSAEWPLARAICLTPEQVSLAVQIAADHAVPVSVAGGRKDVYGRNSRSGHLVIDLRYMQSAVYDSSRGIVTAGGGITTEHLLEALPLDIVTPTVMDANVGVVGAAAGGGYGMLCGSFGLMCDALASAQMVLADGRIVEVSENENPDLLWMLRGGGTGAGVVTSATFTTHRCSGLLAGQLSFPLTGASEVLLTMQALLDEHADTLGLMPIFIKTGDQEPILIVVFGWNGGEKEGRAAFEHLAAKPGASAEAAKVVPYRATLDQGAIWPWAKCWAGDSRTIARITPESAGSLIDAAGDMQLPGSILFLHDFHGAATRMPEDSAAFALRCNHYIAMAAAPFEPGDEAAAEMQKDWIESVKRRLTPSALPGGYINFLPPSEGDRVSEGFGRKRERLAGIKSRYDPQDLFRTAAGRLG